MIIVNTIISLAYIKRSRVSLLGQKQATQVIQRLIQNSVKQVR